MILLAATGLLLSARRLDLLGLGDDASRLAGADPRVARVTAFVLAVLLSACAVTIAGPIGFVGLVRPGDRAAAGPARPRTGPAPRPASDLRTDGCRGGHRCPTSSCASSWARSAGVEIPTGSVTTVFGAIFLVLLALRMTDAGLGSARRRPAPACARAAPSSPSPWSCCSCSPACWSPAALLGDAKLLLGDVLNWITGQAGNRVTAILDTRMPRVAAALLAGVGAGPGRRRWSRPCRRNPLAEPGILGVSAGGGLAAIVAITMVPMAGAWLVTGCRASRARR